MKGIATVITLFTILFATSQAKAEGCRDQTATLRQSAIEEFDKAKQNYKDLMPEPGDYMSQVKKCIGSLGNWTASIGFKMPSMDQILRSLCDEVRSQIDIPRFDFKVNETIGVGNTRTRYEVSDEDAEVLFREIWPQIWEQ
ncbi:MAG: hypothetical protein PVH87_28580 [Desulfobacteraceae bacterium]|jgi:hypothetical protein